MAKPAEHVPTQLGPEAKFLFSPFSYAKAIIKDNVTYPIVPNCPIINVGNPMAFDASNIPVGTLFIVHFQNSSSSWKESLCLRVPDDTITADFRNLANGFVIIGTRTNSTPGGGENVYQ